MLRVDAAAPARTRRAVPWAALRALGGVAVLAFLVWKLGSGPFLAGIRMIDGWALAAGLGIGATTVVACAWRWRLVARGLGLRLPLSTAVANCYRSLLINATLPGGVLGDVHRAVDHGRDEGDLARAVRAVVWERTAGQVVQCTMALALLTVLPSPVRPVMPWVDAAVLVVVLGAVPLLRRAGRRGTGRWARWMDTLREDVRAGILAPGIWPGIVIASAVAVVGHLATFLVAARTVELDAPAARLLPLLFLALLAMGVPANVGGFGPREGVAAWTFTAAGLSAAQGVAAATVYGALVLVASLPGVVVLLFRRFAVPG